MAGASAEASLLRSPRSNLRHLLTHPSSAHKAPDPSTLPPLDTVVDAALTDLIPADADAKLHRRKLYLVLDLDETLVYSQRMEAGATPKGTQIFVRGQAFDMITRPGLQYFLRSAHQNYVCYLYTMGDQDYTQAVLKVIDPTGKYFKGARRPRAPPRRAAPTRPGLGKACVERFTPRFSHLFSRAPAPSSRCAPSQAACAVGGRPSRA